MIVTMCVCEACCLRIWELFFLITGPDLAFIDYRIVVSSHGGYGDI
jgi:hypothetical protein